MTKLEKFLQADLLGEPVFTALQTILREMRDAGDADITGYDCEFGIQITNHSVELVEFDDHTGDMASLIVLHLCEN